MLARGMPAVQAPEAFVSPGIGTAATGLTLPSGDTSSVRTHLPTKGGRAQTTCAIEGGEFLSYRLGSDVITLRRVGRIIYVGVGTYSHEVWIYFTAGVCARDEGHKGCRAGKMQKMSPLR